MESAAPNAPNLDPTQIVTALGARLSEAETGVKQALANASLGAEAKQAAEGALAGVKQVRDGQTDLADRLSRLEATGNRPSFTRVGEGVKGLGDYLVEAPEFEAIKMSCVGRITLRKSGEKGLYPTEIIFADPKAQGVKELSEIINGLSAGSGGALLSPIRVGQSIIGGAPAEVPLRTMMQYVDATTLIADGGGSKLTWPREKGLFQMWATATADFAGSQKNIIVNKTSGFYKGQRITINPKSTPTEEAVVASYDEKLKKVVVTANLANSYVAGTPIVSSTYAATPETELKPSGAMEFEEVEIAMKTIASSFVVTRQMLRKKKLLGAYVTRRANEELTKSENRQIIYGDPTDSKQLAGFANDAKIVTKYWSGLPVTASDPVQAVTYMIALLGAAGYSGTRVLVNDMDLWKMRNVQDSNKRPIYADGKLPFEPIVHPAVKQGEVYIARFDNIIFAESAGVTVEFMTQHEDYALRNLVLVLIEEEIGTLSSIPESSGKLILDAAPSAGSA